MSAETPPDKRPGIATAAEADGLADIRRRRDWAYASIIAGVPIIYGAVLLFGDSRAGTMVWAALVLGVGVWDTFARCPRCHQFFNWSERRRRSEKCAHCGLELHAVRSSDGG